MDTEIPLPPPPKIRHRSPAGNDRCARRREGEGPDVIAIRDSPFHKPQRLSKSRSRPDDISSIPSSDPAFFSSDDIPSSSLENYKASVIHGGNSGGYSNGSSQSRKRRYRGTWWGEVAVEAKRKRGDFRDKRHLDSGVWMGSEGSLSSENLISSEDTSCEGYLQSPSIDDEKRTVSSVMSSRAAGHELRSRHYDCYYYQQQPHTFCSAEHKTFVESLEHKVARDLIDTFIDEGQDSIDLTNRGLRMIPYGLLRPLQHLTKQLPVDRPPITDDVYTSLTPFLRLFLSGNNLAELGSELFELDSLKVLSLRNNKLREIPPAIRRLTMLQELNVSVNKLQYLPWEILCLIRKGDLKQMVVHPNRFIKFSSDEIEKWHYLPHSAQQRQAELDLDPPLPPPSSSPSSSSSSPPPLRRLSAILQSITYDGPPPEEAWAPIHVATSQVQHFDSEGLPVPSVLDSKILRSQSSSSSTSRSRVPSLRELALLESVRFSSLDQFLSSEEIANYPGSVVRLLRQACDVRNTGGRICSVCHRNFVIARSEWIEWWDCTTYENGLKGPRLSGAELRPLPFLRKTCSWACVPSEI